MNAFDAIICTITLGPPAIIVGGMAYYGFVWPYFTKKGREERIREKEQKQKLRDKIESTRRVVFIDGENVEIITVPFTLLQNRKSTRLAAVISYGSKSYLYVQPLKKDRTIGKAKPHWSHSSHWLAIGTVELNRIEQRTGIRKSR